MALSRKERRALQYLREQSGLPPAKPWAYQKQRAERLRDIVILRELIALVTKHRVSLGHLRGLLDTGEREQPKTV
jgi:hypothetical protein